MPLYYISCTTKIIYPRTAALHLSPNDKHHSFVFWHLLTFTSSEFTIKTSNEDIIEIIPES